MSELAPVDYQIPIKRAPLFKHIEFLCSLLQKEAFMSMIEQVLVTGGAGYVGAVLVPRLLNKGYRVRVLDLYIFGEHVLDEVKNHPNLEQFKGDIRDQALLRQVLRGCDAVIHLACISNDSSFEGVSLHRRKKLWRVLSPRNFMI